MQEMIFHKTNCLLQLRNDGTKHCRTIVCTHKNMLFCNDNCDLANNHCCKGHVLTVPYKSLVIVRLRRKKKVKLKKNNIDSKHRKRNAL